MLLHEVTNELRNLIRSSVEREMTGIEDVDFGCRHVFAVSFWFTEIEREIVITPDYQQTRLIFTHPFLGESFEGNGFPRDRQVTLRFSSLGVFVGKN